MASEVEKILDNLLNGWERPVVTAPPATEDADGHLKAIYEERKRLRSIAKQALTTYIDSVVERVIGVDEVPDVCECGHRWRDGYCGYCFGEAHSLKHDVHCIKDGQEVEHPDYIDKTRAEQRHRYEQMKEKR